ncbi:F-box only protein 47 isoform X3 [Chiroxiphia lanceolata]|uniref:F-box only protein 47 isoform X3 n=1 Tax=Chiroxiphia lanceolata TaxID=296741 RepID=UPI0013CE7540|nr:F-box only protein 47 isoform X3 [Chiroxiphia lanceolata]
MSCRAGDSCPSTPSHKPRRSRRRSRGCWDTLDTDSQALSALGHFQTLPLEIFHMVLKYLSGTRRLLLQDFHNLELPGRREGASILEHYKSLGLLLKRCTLLLPTRDRLKYVHKVLSEVSCFKLSGCASPLHCLGLKCYGVFLQILTAGWDELECHRVFNFLWELSSLARKVQTVVSSRAGSARKLELRIRLYCRRVLLNHWIHRSDSAFWLTRILKPWPIVNQARLLYIIFGPVSSLDGHVVWQKMIEGPTDESSLKGLAEAIKLLYDTEAREWTADDVISLVDELSVVPQEWLMENSARLLLLSGNNICFTFMASKAVNGRAVELARLMVFMALVCEKDLYCMDWVVKMMQKVCRVFSTPWERNNFLQCLENTFAHMLMDMLQAVLAGGHDEEDNTFLNLFHLVNAQANFHKEILFLAMRSSPSST